ncbi:1-phosphofructokinase family hexose kinase [Kosmotoga pacifica]|uniref:Ribokinase n=1 Tax=Kosmotoga pacifica TaxID=1330330 RepID=A0A0G2Z990_9BACT|nr:PfkB family carbohydrate kinase [Kosmotoga pacifica]AKI98127.1 ribokinase [Kosmotoga pacifica]
MQVLTVSLNPALDREVVVSNFRINELHRINNQKYSVMEPGGKGINVSLILSGLKIPNMAMGFLGGFIGSIVEQKLRTLSEFITTNFVYVEEETRENLAIIDPSNDTITEINSLGPNIDERALMQFERRYSVSLKRAECVVMSGSIPPGVPTDYYLKLGMLAKAAGKIVVSEAIGEHFEIAVKNGVFTVAKPDLRSQNNYLGGNLNTLDDFVDAAMETVKLGSKMAILSYRIEGDVIATSEGVWMLKAKAHIERSHLLGTGDSFVAGVVYKLLKNKNEFLEAAKLGMAAAIAETKFIGKEFISIEDISKCTDAFEISRLR